MSSPNHCPSCNIEWEEKQTITEHFVNEGYTLSKAVQTGAMYGCTPNTPQHFGVNVVGIEIQGQYDGVSYWKCTSCGTVFDRWTMKPVDNRWELGT